ncbi:MAG TPA: ECF-type sigma factor [Methylomirabilota bacterium]|nr:ECF-type sigma factor [Methylomirabilota bacterium]
MRPGEPDAPPGNAGAKGLGAFVTTHWSVVLAAKDESSPAADGALAQLCRVYWYPLYAFIRRRGYGPHDAQDLTQEFFYRLLDKRYLSAVDHRKGRFRTFLLAALEHFLANEWRRSQTQRRGGGRQIISIDDSAERRYALEPATELSPERIYEQRWTLAFLEQVLGRLRAEFVAAGKGTTFDALKVFLTGDRPPARYAELANALGTTEAALKMAVSRLRQRYADLLRQEIAHTVSGPDEVEDELRALMTALG